MEILLWSSLDSKRCSRIQNAFPELPAGKGGQHVSSCHAQLQASEVIPRVAAAYSGWLQHNSWGGPINWVMTVLQTCSLCPWVCAAGLQVWISIEIWLQYYSLLKESMSFGVKLHAAPAKLNEYIGRRQKQLYLNKDKWFQSSNYTCVL